MLRPLLSEAQTALPANWLTAPAGGVSRVKNERDKRPSALSPGTAAGLVFIHRYRFLAIAQFARAAGFSGYHSAEVLRGLERWGVVGHFGYTGIPFQGKTPKVLLFKTERVTK
jgi:hypothetical protein